MCEFHDSNSNGLGYMWWTDKCIYFSSIDIFSTGPCRRDDLVVRERDWQSSAHGFESH